MREILIPMMQMETIRNYKLILEDLVTKHIINELSINEPVIPYEVFKKFATMLSLRLFLNLENQEAEELSKLATSHWHGIISVPLSVKVPFLMSSSYRKAVQARDQILDIIVKCLENQNSSFLSEVGEKCHQTDSIDHEFFKVCVVLYSLWADLSSIFKHSYFLVHTCLFFHIF